MTSRRHFGRRRPNPTFVGSAVIVAILIITLPLLYLTRKKPSPYHPPDILAVIISGTPTSGQQHDYNKLLAYAANRKDVLIIASARHPNVAQSDPLAGTGINNLSRQNNQAKAENTARQLYAAAVAPGGNTDLQRSFDAVYDIVHTIPHERVWVAALGPVVAIAQGVKLDNPLTRGDPATSIADIQGGFISSCSGWDLYVAEGSAQLSSLAEAQDQEYWRKLMLSCGGRLTAWTIHVGIFPSTNEVVPWTARGHCTITFALEGRTLFATGKFQLLPSANGTLYSILRRVKDARQPRLRIDGYTDNQGPVSYNEVLSDNRAQSVAEWFLARGINHARLAAMGHGENDPVASNRTAQGRQLNRRVEVTLQYRSCSSGAE